MPPVDENEVSFQDLGNVPVPEKGDIREEARVDRVTEKIAREEVEKAVRQETGTEKEKPKTPIPPDVPIICFKIAARFIECPKFELDEEEARILAHHLTILIPFEGKIISVIVILMVVANKVLACTDAIKKKFAPKPAPEEAPVKTYRPEMDAAGDAAKQEAGQ
jgi:hypothetical protein